LDPYLAALLEQFAVEARANPSDGMLECDVVTFIDAAAARAALKAFHSDRWRRPPDGAGPVGARLSDLGELVGALLLHKAGHHGPESIYPLTFASPGPTAQPAGIDVIGISLDGAGPLAADERLSLAEAKSTLEDNAGNAIGGIQADVEKCTAERVSDSLHVLKWEYERAEDPNQDRLHLFLTSNSAVYGSIVIDPLVCDVEAAVASIFSRLEDKFTPTGAPLVRVFLLALPGAALFIEETI
jgi:hypothetical protein